MDQAKKSQMEVRVLRGSLIVLKRRCGKSNCRCAKGEPHRTPVLSYSVRGVTRMVSLQPEQVPGVKAALGRYRRELARLEREAMAGTAALRTARLTGKSR
jgi:hypothetical protein